MLVMRFKIEAISPASRQVPNPAGGPLMAVQGVNVRAVPISSPADAQLKRWYANSPLGQVGFAVFGPHASQYQVGIEIEMSLDVVGPHEPAQK